MPLLYLSDILEKTGLDLRKIKLIRHSLNDKECNNCYKKGLIKEYTQLQKTGFSSGYDYWVTFIGGNGTTARLEGIYEVGDSIPAEKAEIPDGYIDTKGFSEGNSYFSLNRLDLLKDFEDRLVIDWGSGAIVWHQKATTPKAVIAIHNKSVVPFPGFENITLSYNELKEIVEDNDGIYSDWHTALSSVNAIYVIVDTKSGKQYVGSAYGEKGLLGRWSCYADTKHGGNKRMIDLLDKHQNRYEEFQFSILQVTPKSILLDQSLIALEGLYKRKLQTIKFGLNDN